MATRTRLQARGLGAARTAEHTRNPARVAFAVLVAGALAGVPAGTHAFTQSGAGTEIANTVPMGHEWITRLSALELMGGDPIVKPDPKDPRKHWTHGKAKNPDLSDAGAQAELRRIKARSYPDKRYQSTYKAVYDAIVGERWVDLGGFNVAKSMLGKHNCWDAVAQEPAEAQYDHFMRRYDERGGEGGVQAAQKSRERFVEYFVNAAMAPPTSMVVWDGGAYSALAEVDRNYFLFGRAVHLFQDSFSSEHTVRLPKDNYEQVRQVKSYLCAAGSEQHTHSNKDLFNYHSGDVIWKPGTGLDPSWNSYIPSNMKDVALVSTEATKDLWAAFIRTMGTPLAVRKATAQSEAETLAKTWLRSDDAEVRKWYENVDNRKEDYVLNPGESGEGQSVKDCMKGLGVKTENKTGEQMQLERVHELQETQRICLFNVKAEDGYSDLYDPSLHMPYNWAWVNQLKWLTPPKDWTPPRRPADTGKRVQIKSRQNDCYLSAPDGIQNNAWIYCRAGTKPLEFIQVGDARDGYYRLTNAPLFMSYTWNTGAVKLYNSPKQANYRLAKAPAGSAGTTIQNLHWNQYMWLYKESPYVSRTGDPAKRNAQWIFEYSK